MTRLEELIQQFCPEGVKYDKIKNVFSRLKGTPITASKMKEIACPDGEIRIFAGGKTIIDAHEKDIPKANITRVPAVLVQSRGIIDVIYYDKPFTFKNEMWAYSSSNPVTTKFLYYLLKSNIEKFREAASGMGSLPQISLPVTDDFRIPLPPLEVQQEIVRILDQFTQLTAELTTELTARKKQYEYYQKYLLNFDNNVKWVPLGEIANITDYVANGSFASLRENVSYKKEPNFAVLIRTADYSANFDPQQMVYIDEHAYEFLAKSKLFGGEIIINNIGAGVGTTFRCPNLNMPMSLAPNSVVVRTDDDAFYYYWFISQWGQNAIRKIISKSAMPKFNKTGLRSIKVPVPTKEVRERIVNILDRFDALCNDLTSGLPAEIAARQKQYEYYRDKLLTFPQRKEAKA